MNESTSTMTATSPPDRNIPKAGKQEKRGNSMTNFKIVAESAIQAGLYTEEEALFIIEEEGRLPLHTFGEWKRMGYSVKKGETAALKAEIWKKSTKKQTCADKDGNEQQVDPKRFCKKLSHFFTADQVEKIA